MIVSHEWLRAFVPHDLSPEAVGELLSRHVVTLDRSEQLRAELREIVVARVVSSEKIPDTRLSFNIVDDGAGALLEVVCGAPNVEVGAMYPFARSGTTLPGGLTIERRKIRGFTSNGMLCSAKELGLGADQDGILRLDTLAAPGTPLLTALPLGDVRLELDVLPNRPDLLSHLGVARELSALAGVPLRHPPELGEPRRARVTQEHAVTVSHSGITLRIAPDAGCSRYVGVVIRGVRVGPSPTWLAQRIESFGGRSINNVVDATNYMLHGFGQPVHAFDLARLGGSTVEVRGARAGERLVTLDGVSRALETGMTVIADATVPAALAGVMGGKDSEVTDSTTDVLLEVAVFDPRRVRSARRAMGLSTDASYRYERGVDAAATVALAEIGASLIAAVAGGSLEAMLVLGTPPAARPAVLLRHARVNRLLGAEVPPAESARLLGAIGFNLEPAGADALLVTPPSWRHDVARDVDLIEEVARLRGYDILPDDLRPFRTGTARDHPLVVIGARVRAALVAEGIAEARPMPFTRAMGNGAETHWRVTNPLSDDEPFLRVSLLESLAKAAEYNLNRHQGNVRLFEVGDAFVRAGSAGFREELHAAVLVMGDRRPPHFTEPKPPAYDAWDAKALALRVAGAAWPGQAVTLEPGNEGALWAVVVGGHSVGHVSCLTLDAPVWAKPAFGVELALGVLDAAPVAAPGQHEYAPQPDENHLFARYAALPTTPAAEFDLALLVPDTISAEQVETVLRNAAGELMESARLFDEFRGAGVPSGSRSLAWRLTFRHPERTLRDKEIDGRRSQLLKTLEKELGVIARTT